jgi:hypothetical protein
MNPKTSEIHTKGWKPILENGVKLSGPGAINWEGGLGVSLIGS